MDKENRETIRYRFTKYLETALSRTKRDFLQKEGKKTSMEDMAGLEQLHLEDKADNMMQEISYMEAALEVP